ncbi:MAG: PAS domain S-box protein [Candidatus Hermodarchaeota archaeon]
MTSSSTLKCNISEIFMENFEGLIFVLNPQFKCEYINESIHNKVLGYSVLSKKIQDIIYFADIKQARKFLNDILKFGKATERIRIKQYENYAFFQFNGSKFITEDNQTKILLVGTDISRYAELEYEITERERTLKRLADSMPEMRFWKLLQVKSEKSSFQKSQEMLDLVIDSVPHYVYWKNKDLEYIGCNKNYALINHLESPYFIVGKLDKDLPWASLNYKKLHELEKKVIENNRSQEGIETWDNINGEIEYYDVNRIPLQNLNQDVVGILCTYINISKRIEIEQNLKKSEEKYRSILENIKEGYFEVDLKGTFTFCNDYLSELWKYSKDEIIGKNYRQFTNEENIQIIYKAFNAVFTSRKNMRYFQFEFNDRENNIIIAETSINLRFNQLGNITGFYGIVHDITEKFQLEQQLKASEERYRHLFNKSPFAVWLVDLEGNIIDCNETTNKLLSIYKKEDLINKNFIEALSLFERPEYYIPFFKSKFESFIRDEPLKTLEFSITRGDGKKVWLTIQSSKIKVDNEDLVYVIIQDITIKKEAELKLQKSEEELRILNKKLEQIIFERTKELRESEEKFRNIAEQSSLGIVILQDGYIVYTNKALSKITEYSSDEINKWSQNKFIRKIHPDDLKFVLEQLRKKLDGDKELLSHYSCRVLTKSKNYKWIDLHSKAITYKGKFADFITFIDITDRKEAEQKLIESEEKFRHLYQKSPCGIALLDMKGTIIDMNSTVFDLFGYPKEELIGKNYINLIGLYPNETKKAIRTVDELMGKGETERDSFHPNIVQILNKDGAKVWIASEISIVKVGDDKIIQAIIQDITEKKESEEKLKNSEKKLREQNIELMELDRLKTDFISIAAHELKTPLISIGGYIDLILLREKELQEEIKEDLNHALNNVHRLEDYINKLLDVMKIDAKKMQLVKQDENIYDIIKNTLLELEFQIQQKKIKVIINVPNSIKAKIDAFRLGQVFSNILSNAVKFTPEQGLIEILSSEDEMSYTFKIRDNGKGMTIEEKQKLFGKFVTLSHGADYFSTFNKGSGLGLYIAKGIIEAHGGTIWAQSEGIGKGTAFNFTIPKL